MTSKDLAINQKLNALLSLDTQPSQADHRLIEKRDLGIERVDVSSSLSMPRESAGSGNQARILDLTRQYAPVSSIDFSFIFFSDSNQSLDNKYKLVMDIAEFADQHEYTAVWLPERHFHPFGGIYPNPAVLAAALAVKTKHIRLRSGSVVLPLHHPAEVVESWSMIDNLSNGRVDLGFASGWNPNDFIAAPETYQNRKQIWHDRIPLVQKLWRGESLNFLNGNGKETAIQIFPSPIQNELNVWLVVTKSDESFHYAGTQGYNILTMLQGIDFDELGDKIKIYRDARHACGFDPKAGKVTLMLHTLVHEDLTRVEAAVREPFKQYIKSALSGHIEGMKERPTQQEINKIVDYSYQRYFTTGALFGSVEDAKQVVKKAMQVGVNELACLMDFGVEPSLVMESLPYLNALKKTIAQEVTDSNTKSSASQSCTQAAQTSEPIAIIGLHGFLPQAMDIQEFWQYLDADQSAITEIPIERFNWRDYFDPTGKNPNKMRTKFGGFIPNISDFDPSFFGILPQDADLMDPQQRLLLMSVYKTIEDAGYQPHDLQGSRTGVYIAIEDNEYLTYLRKNHVDLGANGFNHHPSMAANRISYFFNLSGPSELVNTMCSSAATALHLARNALLRGEVDLAIVGGARIILDPEALVGLSRMNVMSTSNSVKSFGKDANGYLRAEGVASVVLKRLSHAVRDKDSVYALIKSSAVNYNGQGGMSIAAPNKERHIEVIKTCYKNAGVDIRNIRYIETQGMGNQVGDIAEWEACNGALEQLAREANVSYEPGYCRVSTLKPMIGHMECVSAFGALFKIIRSLQTNTIHKILNLDTINPYLKTENRPCRLLSETEDWGVGESPRLAGLHSYGSGGSNAHLLIEEYQNTHTITKKKRAPTSFKKMRCWVDLQPESMQMPMRSPGQHIEAGSCEKKANGLDTVQKSLSKRICIIGAGPSGLVMAKSLLEEGHQPVIFEKQHTLGGLWVLNKTKTAGAYKKTRFQSSKFTSLFSDFYSDDIKNNFYSVMDVKRYLDNYAEHFHLPAHIHYHHEVIEVTEKQGQWEVKVQEGNQKSVHFFDGVALCQGSFWQPNLPQFKGIEQFKGRLLHSGEYYDNTIFQNKRVLVIGNGVSAMDIAEEAAAVADKVLWSRRSTKLILPRMVGFVPNDCQSPASLMIEMNRTNLIERLQVSMPDYYKTYVKSGILPTQDQFEKNPVVHINDGIVQLVADGKIIAKSQVSYFDEHGCVFNCGPYHEDIDVVVFCTGYNNFGHQDLRYDYLKNISVANEFSMGIFYEKNPSLVNTSVLPIAFTGSFYFLEMVARWYAQMLSGRFLLTEEEKRARITPEHYLIMAPISSVLFGLRLGLFPKPEEEFKEFWKLLNYPAFPMIQRLRGFHHHEQALMQLRQFIKTSYVKTDQIDPALKELKYRILAGLGMNTLHSLLLKGEINQIEFTQAQVYLDRPYHLNWESQYIKKSAATIKPGERKSGCKEKPWQSPLRQVLSKKTATLLRIREEEVDWDKNLSEYGFDSISLTGLAQEITACFPFVTLEPSVFLDCPTLAALFEHLYEQNPVKFQAQATVIDSVTHANERQSTELVVLQAGKEKGLPSFWFHAALGTVQMYSPLASALSKDIPMLAIQAKGLLDHQAPYTNLIEMAQYYSEILLRINQGRAFQLGGYSQGGVIAYEVARQLQLAGETVKNIVMIDAPYPPVISFLSEKHCYLLTLLNLLQMHNCGSLADIDAYSMEGASSEEYLGYLTKMAITKGLRFSETQLYSMLRHQFQVSDANIRSMHGYSAARLLFPEQIACHYFQREKPGQFFSNRDSTISEFNMQNRYYQQSNCTERWQILLPNFNLHKTTACDHFSFFEDSATLRKIIDLCQLLYMPESPSNSFFNKADLDREHAL